MIGIYSCSLLTTADLCAQVHAHHARTYRRCVFEQIDVSFLCVCPVIDHEFRHNIVKVAVDPRGDSRVDPQTTLTML